MIQKQKEPSTITISKYTNYNFNKFVKSFSTLNNSNISSQNLFSDKNLKVWKDNVNNTEISTKLSSRELSSFPDFTKQICEVTDVIHTHLPYLRHQHFNLIICLVIKLGNVKYHIILLEVKKVVRILHQSYIQIMLKKLMLTYMKFE